ncbi:aminodeoxychorismate/anthranilate synthase component II [Neobacillus niacini]|uniref:aminodeoxychorismate/anthranilate synthase component II n=1 Tax=Neobacillus niacini TaxID=86668 RepID=UPI0039833B40
MIFMVDNYDSFTFNLVQYLGELGEELVVKRNNQTSLDEIKRLDPEFLMISPGPGNPTDAGISLGAIEAFSGVIPILGVCLGHQAIAQAYKGDVVGAQQLMHGKTSDIYHDERTIFSGLPNPFQATRYHSLIVNRETLPNCFEISAWTKNGEIMAIRHKELPTEGVQFHPESILTTGGKKILKNFVQYYGKVQA